MLESPGFFYQSGASQSYRSFGSSLSTKAGSTVNTLFIPFVATIVSAFAFLISLNLNARRNAQNNGQGTTPKPPRSENEDPEAAGFRARFKHYSQLHGGKTIVIFKATQLLGNLALFALTLYVLAKDTFSQESGRRSFVEWKNSPQIALVATFCYTSVLSSLSLVPGSWSQIATLHTDFVLFVSLGVYLYRDVWPFATYTCQPEDIEEGWLLWFKIGILGVTAVVIPLFVPRRYVPVDPEHPMEVLNPEQTASIYSLMVFNFLNPVISEASRVPHLPHERLPPLSDYDYSKHLTEVAFPYLDPFRGANKDRHLFWGMVHVFFWNLLGMALALFLNTVAGFASPVAINRILVYLESDKPDLTTRPWIWVFVLFVGPSVVSLSLQCYVYLSTRNLARLNGILTELIFEHSFRMRFKAETSAEDRAAGNLATETVAEGDNEEGLSPEATMVGSSATQSDDAQSTRSKSSAAAKDKANDSPVKVTHVRTPKKMDNLVGKINTLVTVDLDNIGGAKDFLFVVLQIPLELSLAIAFLYLLLGWSALVGLASIVVLIPAPGYVAKQMQNISKRKMEKTDARVENVSQSVGIIRMIKLFGWETKMKEKLSVTRDEELKWIFRDKVAAKINNCVNFFIPTITMLVTYATYTLIAKQSLTPSKIFSSMAVFEIVRGVLHRTSHFTNSLIRGKVSLERVGDFLQETELLDSFSRETCAEVSVASIPVEESKTIGFNNATFAWSQETDGTQTPSARSFKLRVPGRITFKPNTVNLIVGPTGSGKTSILMALLGEMHFIAPNIDSWYNLPRDGGIAYAAQESWVQNETIKANILFGASYDEERYKKVIRQCALEHDLKLFEAGDKTEVGEKGLTLSGGQKARVTLARAIYSSAQIVLLDDILAALDVHTSKHIVTQCLQGDLLKGRTVLLVTHNVALTSPVADHIVAIGLDGVAREVSDIAEVLAFDKTLAVEENQEEDKAELEMEVIDVKKDERESVGKLIVAEEIETGHVTWKSLRLFIKGLGGTSPILFFTAWIGGLIIMHGGNLFAFWFIGHLGTQFEMRDPSHIPITYYLGIYTTILLSAVLVYLASCVVYHYGSQRASRIIHSQLIDSVFSATLRWLDETPVSRIITRCTQDIGTIDIRLPAEFFDLAELTVYMVVKLVGPLIFAPLFILPASCAIVFGVYVGNKYLKAQLSVKRELSIARAPLVAHFGAAINGLVSIRAYGAQKAFMTESFKRIDHYTKVQITSYNLNRWIGVRTDALGAILAGGLSWYLLVTRRTNSANTGFSMTSALEFCNVILWLVRTWNEFEVFANSLERVHSYLEIEHEPKPTQSGTPPAAWPKSGELQVDHLSARYSSNGPNVLHNISFHVKSGERIGIVGRTGSGKSSLTLSLLRCILTEGDVIYDGIPTSKLNLDALRSSITIIPQVPELLSGTLRQNLDPFEQHDDATLNGALRASGLFSLQTENDDLRLTLDSAISSGGSNLSVGQRQILALARAIVRNSKLLILDEATSAIDHKTDSIIQSSLRNELAADVTVLTVAHRLQTIMDADKIMVLDSGRIVEYDSPQILLGKTGSQFKALVDGSGDKKALYAAAEAKQRL